MSDEEKKLLYRYSYRQTLAEFEAPTGYWKVITSVIFFVVSCATFYAIFLNRFVSICIYLRPQLISFRLGLSCTSTNIW